MSNGTANEEDQRSRAINLFRYLRAVAELRLRQTLDVDGWEQVIWLHDLTAPSNCLTRLDYDDLDDWIRVERPAAPPPPPHPPPLLKPWVDLEQVQDWRGAPELRRWPAPESSAPGTRRAETVHSGFPEDQPDILNAWSAYEDQWLDWAARREAVEPDHDIYRKFFRAFNRAEQLGEQYEVVVAVGLLSWRLPGGTIRRHLVTTPASLTYDVDSGLISVAPSNLGNQQMILEDEMVPANSRPTHVSDEIRVALDNAHGPFDDSVATALRRWVLAADESGVFSQAPEPANGATRTPDVRFAPAVVLRRRLQGSLRRTYEEIISRLTDGGGIPPTVDSLVNDTADAQHDVEMTSDTPSFGFEMPERLFFPLQTNPQQQRIVEELGRRRGVVVQGPPGTGKSHTIANLISHCLATDKRVLVTSHTERALRVIKEKLPDNIRDLTVSVLGAGRAGASDLQRSANALLGRRSDPGWSVENLDAQIERHSDKLRELEGERDRHRENLAQLRAAASKAHQLRSGYSGPVGDIAQVLSTEQDAHGWLPDRVSGPMPLRYEQLLELKALREQVRDIDTHLASFFVPSPDTLPTTEQLRAVGDKRTSARQVLASHEGHAPTGERLRRSSVDLQNLAELLRIHVDADQAARRRSEPWLTEALTDWDEGRTNQWLDLQRRTSAYLDCAYEHPYEGLDPTTIEATRLLVLHKQASDLIEHVEAGGRFVGFFGKPSRAARQNAEALDVADRLGLPLSDLRSALHFRALLEEVRDVIELGRQWGRHAELLHGTLAQVRARLRDHKESLDHLAAVSEARTRLSEAAGDILRDPVDTAEDVVHLQGSLHVAVALTARDAAQAEHHELMAALTSVGHASSHPTFRELFSAAEDLQIERYTSLRTEMEHLFGQQRQLEDFQTLRDAVRVAAPKFCEELFSATTAVPESEALDRAWRWSWAISEIERLRNRSESELIKRLHGVEPEIANFTTALASALAWRNTLRGMTEHEAQELKAYQQALRRLGKGLGKQAATHRSDAQRHLANCQTAVRAWIMPTYRVAETLRAEPESFDVVIVDEASQSGVDALFLFWLGKQVVIVGDDNQISPSHIGILADDVSALQQQHLRSLGLRDLLGIDNSLFDQAKVRYSGEVWLTEHFRCMPEIIEFSNRLLYAPQHRRLEPLRQFGNDRLRPLERRHVPHGQREGSSSRAINRAEAHELIDVLIQCHEDSRYESLTFGVIGLLGAQADYIEAQLLERLPNEAWGDRQLRCGDAYDFQGDERDVIFLSMVASLEPNRNHIPSLGHRSHEQRYNVAASRARDQMWLFHSMTPEQLNPQCVRYKLLNHFLVPPEADVTPFEEPVSRDSNHPAFDSLFEQRVFLDIRERGYVARPQVEAYGNRIDIVIAGSHRKLAVECDGAAWHGPEQYAKDLTRQRNLERAGWTFFRIRDTDYYLDPRQALEPLWGLLRDLDIHPRGMGGEPIRVEALSPGQQAQSLRTTLPDGAIRSRLEDSTELEAPSRPNFEGHGANPGQDREQANARRPLEESHADRSETEAISRVQETTQRPNEVANGIHGRAIWGWTENEETAPPTAPASGVRPLANGQQELNEKTSTGPAVTSTPSRETPRSGMVGPAESHGAESERHADIPPEPVTDRKRPAFERLGHLLDVPRSEENQLPESLQSGNAQPEPYVAWQIHPVQRPDHLDTDTLVKLIIDIVAVEGPVVAERVFERVGAAAGIQSLGENSNSALRSATTEAVRRGKISRTDPLGLGGIAFATLRLPSHPDVRVRDRGQRRTIRQIPPEEVAAALDDARRQTSSAGERYRAVLNQYGFHQMTHQVRTYLQQCERLLDPAGSE